MTKEEELDAYFAWRDGECKRDRIMTVGEYMAWARGGGDALSSSRSTRSGWRSLTIVFGQPVIGTVVGGVMPPKFGAGDSP